MEYKGSLRASGHGASHTTLNHSENVVSEVTRDHERREARGNTAYAGLWRNIVRRAVARAHCGIDVPDLAHDPRAVY